MAQAAPLLSLDQADDRSSDPPLDPPMSRRARAEARRIAAADDNRRSFLRMVSHELRTPLNSILGFSEIISQELYGPLGSPQYKEYAGIIRSSGQRLLNLVNQVIEIARLEGDATDLSPCAESLDHALDDVLDALREEITARRTRVTILDQGALPTVMADTRGLRTVLGNLIQNACAYSPEDARLTIAAHVQGCQVEIRIMDCGPGVDPADIPRLLRPFEQGDNALTRRSEGAGLGLPIVDLLCQAMGGRLRLVSPPGEGLTAIVRLPAA